MLLGREIWLRVWERIGVQAQKQSTKHLKVRRKNLIDGDLHQGNGQWVRGWAGPSGAQKPAARTGLSRCSIAQLRHRALLLAGEATEKDTGSGCCSCFPTQLAPHWSLRRPAGSPLAFWELESTLQLGTMEMLKEEEEEEEAGQVHGCVSVFRGGLRE